MDRLRRTPIGQEITAAHAGEGQHQRQRAIDALLQAHASVAADLTEVEGKLERVSSRIQDLADQLKAAQTEHGDLTYRRVEILQRRHQALRTATQRLVAAAPPELLELQKLARVAAHSAKFQMSRRKPSPVTTRIDPKDNERDSREQANEWQTSRLKNKALRNRAGEVLQELDKLMHSPVIDPAAIERLRHYLDVPAELLRAWA